MLIALVNFDSCFLNSQSVTNFALTAVAFRDALGLGRLRSAYISHYETGPA
jgi:hypothetical protein